jgi:hypothetical protein
MRPAPIAARMLSTWPGMSSSDRQSPMTRAMNQAIALMIAASRANASVRVARPA